MLKKTLTFGIVLVLFLACVGAVSAAPLVTNGGFESPGTFVGVFETYTVLTGWNINSGSIDLINTLWSPASGSYSIDLAGLAPGSISQVLATTPGGKYDLSFMMAGNPGGAPAIKTVEVFWDGVTQGTFTFDTTGKTFSSMGWVPKGKTGLLASGSSTVLKFVDVSGTCCYGVALDDILVISAQNQGQEMKPVVTQNAPVVTQNPIQSSSGNWINDWFNNFLMQITNFLKKPEAPGETNVRPAYTISPYPQITPVYPQITPYRPAPTINPGLLPRITLNPVPMYTPYPVPMYTPYPAPMYTPYPVPMYTMQPIQPYRPPMKF
jgi:choice-of-anchor C domain-containing protein